MFKPMREQVLVKFEKSDEKSFGGIIIPEIAREKARKAEVIAVGDGWQNKKNANTVPLAVKPGDKIIVGSNLKGIDVTLEGEKYELIRENFIFAVLT